MACKKCEREGKTKTIHFERCGRWETRIFCEHTYACGKLSRNEVHHEISRHEAGKIQKRIKRTYRGPRLEYTEAMDNFIRANYVTDGRLFRGQGLMKKLAKEFDQKFGTKGTRPNQLIGRWTRLHKGDERRTVLGQVRGVPSLPVLKFMQDAGSHDA
jgi:hypothetical protein